MKTSVGKVWNKIAALTIIALLVMAAVPVKSVQAGPSVGAPAMGLAGKKVTLDPGHGWSGDSGATGNGMLEKDVTLDIAQRVKSILEGQGVTVVHGPLSFLP